jgi:hypothetical protein
MLLLSLLSIAGIVSTLVLVASAIKGSPGLAILGGISFLLVCHLSLQF